MKHASFFFAMICLLVFSLLAGCTQAAPVPETVAVPTVATLSAEETAPSLSDAQEAAAKCRSTLESLKDCDCYYILQENRFEGGTSLNSTSTCEYFCQGDNWAQLTRIPMGYMLESGGWAGDNIIAYLCQDGQYFNTEREGYVDELTNYHWGRSTAPREDSPWFYELTEPWLMTFDWDAQQVRHISTVQTAIGESIRFQIFAPVADRDCESYTAEFYYNAQGVFEKVVLDIPHITAEGPGRDTQILTVPSTDPALIAECIDFHYKAAQAGCGDRECTVCYPKN